MNFLTKDDCLSDLAENYTKPGHPVAFSGVNLIYNYYNKVLSKEEIKNFLGSNESYTVHREFKRQTRNPSYARFKRYQFQIDLADVKHLKEYNSGVQYLFTCIDCYTRYGFCRGLLNKSADATLDAFKSILQEAGSKPLTCVSDRGSEIRNTKFISFCAKENIKLFHNFTSVHASYVERFNRTLKRLIYSFMTENETNRYIDALPHLLLSYNLRKHRSIKMTPAEAENPENHSIIDYHIQQQYNKFLKKKPKLSVGQLVRIAKQKTPFSRGFLPTTNFEVFRIHSIKVNLPIPLYILEEYDKSNIIKGGFYSFELTPVNSDIFRIEKVLKKKKVKGKEKLYVKWKGFESKYNSWINRNDIVATY